MTQRDPPNRSRLSRSLWLALAYLSLGLAVAGVLIPGLPTTPFVLVAAWAAAKGSERLYAKLLGHRLFGPMIRDWQTHGAVRVQAKWAATISMLAFATILALVAPAPWIAWFGGLSMTIIGIWLWRRPEPRPEGSPSPVPSEEA